MPADITLSTQTDINNFQTTYGPCSVVTGNLTIQDDNDGVDNITDLTPLMNLTSVGGSLSIDNNDALTSLNGLENLTSVDGNLLISNNDVLNTCNQLYYLLDNVDDPPTGPGPGLDGIPDVNNVSSPITIQNNLTNGDCENLQDILNAGPPPIPTMSQWSFFLLGLIVFTVGIVGVYNVKKGSIEY